MHSQRGRQTLGCGNRNKWVRPSATNRRVHSGPILSGPVSNKRWKRTAATETQLLDAASEAIMNGTNSGSSMVIEPSAAIEAHSMQHALEGSNEYKDDDDIPIKRDAPVMPDDSKMLRLVWQKKGNNVLIRLPHDDQGLSGDVILCETSTLVDTATEKPSPIVQLKRIGANKLVPMKSKTRAPMSAAETDQLLRFPAHASNIEIPIGMKAKGRNKLVAQSRLDEERQIKQDLKRKRINAREAAEGAGLKHQGPYKLVSENLAQEEEKRLKEVLKKRLMESKCTRSKGPVKRVKLQHDDDQTAEVKLTDFAYQTTSQMSLVRIAPDDTVPVCRTFSRGIPCTNPSCKKRHDVPLESATPVCSFFQRHGQCLKRETCPFRHIKVDPHATECEQFSLLGYCEDPNCQSKHMRERKSDARFHVG